ncbi:MAG: hypothetical protein EA401_12080 [Planctomycetota bacterium]|nr:MAG: hypothetical protein EA401_12080 [Planctomycetota bacterium]
MQHLAFRHLWLIALIAVISTCSFFLVTSLDKDSSPSEAERVTQAQLPGTSPNSTASTAALDGTTNTPRRTDTNQQPLRSHSATSVSATHSDPVAELPLTEKALSPEALGAHAAQWGLPPLTPQPEDLQSQSDRIVAPWRLAARDDRPVRQHIHRDGNRLQRTGLAHRPALNNSLVRIHETWELDTAANTWQLRQRREMLAEEIVVFTPTLNDPNRVSELVHDHGFTVQRRVGNNTRWVLSFSGEDLGSQDAALARLHSLAQVDRAEPNFLYYPLNTIPNDPHFSQLWGLHNTGQNGGTSGADISAAAAWNITTGSHSVRVAVVDTGVDYHHPDLVDNIWHNPLEIFNAQDLSGNGFVDDVRGWNFYDKNNVPLDDNDHGTHVAGTIGAVGNNDIGITGVAWNVSLIPIRIGGFAGNIDLAAALEAVEYCTAMGFPIANHSWGGPSPSQQMLEAIQAANEAGQLFVAAAGNDSDNTDDFPMYPAAYDVPNIISVAATTRNDGLANFSNYGSETVHLGAPGDSIYSTLPGGGYGMMSGTSMAAPHVAGAAALLLSVRPDLTPTEIRDLFMETGDAISALSDRTISGKRLNIHAALQEVTQAAVHLSSWQIHEDGTHGSTGNGDGFLNPGETAAIQFSALASGLEDSNGVQITVEILTPSISMEPTVYDIGVVDHGASIDLGPLHVSIPSDISTPQPLRLRATVELDNGPGQVYEQSFPIVHSGIIAGTVRQADNNDPIADATLTLSRKAGDPVSLNSDSDGTFSATVPGGEWTVQVQATGYLGQSASVSVPPGNESLDFLLRGPRMTLSSDTLAFTVIPNGAAQQMITVGNEGDADLTYTFFPGPNLLSYEAVASSDSDDLTYTWNSISSTGTRIDGLMDDNVVGPIPLGMRFPFYDAQYEYVYVGSNGLLSFTDSISAPYQNFELPSAQAPNHAIAFLWDDLDFEITGQAHYTVQDGVFILQFTNVPYFNNLLTPSTCQVHLFPDGRIEMHYHTIGRDFYTVGIQKDASTGFTYAHNESAIANGSAVRIAPTARLSFDHNSGALGTPQERSHRATWDADGMNTGLHEFGLRVFSNDATYNDTTLPLSVTITEPLSDPWQRRDVGSPPLSGNIIHSDDTFTHSGAGKGIGGALDSFHLVHQAISGPMRITARISSLDHTNSIAGLMLRRTHHADSAFILLAHRNDGKTFTRRRSTTSNSSTPSSQAQETGPWLRLERQGSIVRSWTSENGEDWAPFQQYTIQFTDDILVGLAVTSHDPKIQATAVFEEVTLEVPDPSRFISIGTHDSVGPRHTWVSVEQSDSVLYDGAAEVHRVGDLDDAIEALISPGVGPQSAQ